ncbi:MAG: hypothetical protein ACR2K5_00505 [Pseudolabrys sp.]
MLQEQPMNSLRLITANPGGSIVEHGKFKEATESSGYLAKLRSCERPDAFPYRFCAGHPAAQRVEGPANSRINPHVAQQEDMP